MFSTFMRGALAAAATLAATAAFASTNLIQDGDFSTPVQTAPPHWSIYSPGVDGWTSLAKDGIEIGASSIYGLPSANAGGQNLELNANWWGTDSYTVTGLTVGATYYLSYDYGGRTDGGPSSATVSFGGVTLTTNSGSIGHWTSNFFQVVASQSSEDLILTAFQTGNTSYGNEFTNFRLSAAPEPSTWAMMGLGFAGLAFAGYRTRRAAISIA
jgi:PEP-CTERM motif